MNMTLNLTSKLAKEDRVRAHTKPDINRRIDRQLEQRLRFFAVQDRETISERLAELDREWDIERTLQANAASLVLVSLILGVTSSRKFLVLPVVISGFLLRHAIQGWSPPVPVLRRLAVRTRQEIDQERYALKILRGDFDDVLKTEGGGVDVAKLIQHLRDGE